MSFKRKGPSEMVSASLGAIETNTGDETAVPNGKIDLQ